MNKKMNEDAKTINEGALDALDRKVASIFPGRFVKKDLVRRVKAGAYIPVFVLEYLLSRYCSSTEKEIIEEGIVHVNEVIAERFVRPEESTKAQSKVKELGKHTIIARTSIGLSYSISVIGMFISMTILLENTRDYSREDFGHR